MSKTPKPSSSKKPAPAKKAAPEKNAEPKAEAAPVDDAAPVKTEKPAKAPKAKMAAADVEAPAEPVEKPAATKAAAASADDTALAKRLAEMTDFALRAYQQSTMRISRDPKHAKSASAKIALAAIETEMARRVASPGSAPSGVRVGMARPKLGKKRD
jgi:hypothetical protein